MSDRFKFRIPMFTDKGTFTEFQYIELGDEIECNLCGCNGEPQQATGLKDKNGTLIYEGDILRYPPKDQYEEKNYVACEVFFHNNDCCDNHIGFQMNRYRFQGALRGIANYGTKYKFIPKNTEKMEVIGNIYENKELIDEQY